MKRCCVGITLCLACLIGRLHAQDTTVVAARAVVVEASRVTTAASDETFRARELELLPRGSTQDLLRIVPGLVIAQHAGGGKAEQLFLRGFDADHGTDVNISVDGAPVNMVSHGHGQGYADLHFVIPELVERIDVIKGPYAAQYGDLTTAGAVTLRTADTLAQNIVKLEGGMFGLMRGLGLAHTTVGTTRLYGGGEYTRMQGYFDAPQQFHRMNLMARSYTPLSEKTSLTASAMHFTSAWNASGQIPDRAVANGTISAFGSIDPNEGGNTSRTTLMLSLDERSNSPLTVRASFVDYRFQLFSNFTFYANDSVRGDMIEQTDARQVYSITASRSFTTIIGNVGLITQLGASARHDNIRAALYHDQARTRLSTTRDASIAQTNLALFAEQTVDVDPIRFVLGLRADYFGFAVTDHAPQLDGTSGTTRSVLVSPKATITYAIDEQTTLFANSGMGFHSNDARVAVAAPQGTTVPRALGAELGARWTSSLATISAAAWLLDLEREFIWVGDEGTTEEAGRSRRLGIDLEGRLQPTPWLTLGANATVSRGRLMDAPIGADRIALAPSLTLTSYAVFTTDAFSASLRLRHIGSRPANESNTAIASGYTLVDVTFNAPLTSMLSITLQCENLLNASWREAQFDTTSRLQGEASTVSEIHFTPGTPVSVRVGVEGRW
jgi:outer membrane receptor protein involved in Fe transport